MLYLRLGTVDSWVEEGNVIKEYEAGRLKRTILAEYGLTLNQLHKQGLDAVRAMWLATEEPTVVVYTGRQNEPTQDGKRKIWASIELGPNGGVHCLLKIACDYTGDRRQFADYMTDTLQRFRKGTRF